MYTHWQIFKQAFTIAFRNPSLWFFGFFAILLGSAAGFEIIIGSYSFTASDLLLSSLEGLYAGGLFSMAAIGGTLSLLLTSPISLFIITILLLLVLGLSVLIIWITTVSQAVLLDSAVKIAAKKKSDWKESFRLGLDKFWPILGLNITMQFAGWFLFFLLSWLTINKFSGLNIIFLIALIIALVIILLVSFTTKYAICGVVLRGWSFIESIKLSWKLFVKNWLVSLEFATALFSVYLFINFVAIYVIFDLLIRLFQFFVFSPYLVFIFFILCILIFLFLQIVLAVFHWSVWALIFEIMSSDKQKTMIRSAIKKVFIS